MMALSRDTKNSTSNPDIFIIRAFDGGQFIALLLSMILLCNNFILDLILSSLFTISITFLDFTKRSRHYYIQFAKLPTKQDENGKSQLDSVRLLLCIFICNAPTFTMIG